MNQGVADPRLTTWLCRQIAPRVGLEPTTLRLTAECSTIELSRKINIAKTTNDCYRTKLVVYHTSIIFRYAEIIPKINFTLKQPSLNQIFRSSPRPISSSQLHTLPCFHLCPIYLVVFKGSYCFRMGYLILRGASRLDAFSVYPFQTWLPGYALGSTTGTPEVRPTRSSRTKVSSSQISCARAG